MAQKDVPDTVKFLTGGLGGIMAWIIVHPSNTLATRMNLTAVKPGEASLGTLAFGRQIVAKEGAYKLFSSELSLLTHRCAGFVQGPVGGHRAPDLLRDESHRAVRGVPQHLRQVSRRRLCIAPLLWHRLWVRLEKMGMTRNI